MLSGTSPRQFPDLPRRPILALALALAALRLSVVYLDHPLARLMGGAPAWLHRTAEWVTRLGRSDIYLVPLGFAVLLLALAASRLAGSDRRVVARFWAWTGGFIWLSIALSGIFNDLVKLIAGRPRPMVAGWGSRPFTFGYDFQSFPSGHSAVAFGLALSIGLIWPRWRAPLLCFASAVAASRVVLNAHYLADVLGGALVAWLTVAWLAHAFQRRGLVFERDRVGLLQPRFPRRRTP